MSLNLLAQIKQTKISLFDKLCYQALLQIPVGKVLSYKDLACLIGKPKSARAVGGAMNRNPFAPQVPCHRVVNHDGNIGGFADGLAEKIKRLQQEGVEVNIGQKIDKKWFFKGGC